MWRSRLKWLWNEAWVEANFCRFDIRLNLDIARSRLRKGQMAILCPVVQMATDLLAVAHFLSLSLRRRKNEAGP